MAKQKTDWKAARRRWESGNETYADIARAIGVTRAAVYMRAKKEGWRRVIPSAEYVQIKADSMDAAAELAREAIRAEMAAVRAQVERDAIEVRAQLIRAHRQEWREHAVAFSIEKIMEGGYEAARVAKMAAEAIWWRQRGERLAWGLDTTSEGQPEEIVIEWMEEPGSVSVSENRLSTTDS